MHSHRRPGIPASPPRDREPDASSPLPEAPGRQHSFNVADGIFNLPFGLGTAGSAEPGNEPMMREEVLELRVPLVAAGAERPFEDHRFDVAIQDLLGIAADVLEGIEVALDEGAGICGEGEDRISHPGVPEDHAEAVEPSHPDVPTHPGPPAPGHRVRSHTGRPPAHPWVAGSCGCGL